MASTEPKSKTGIFIGLAVAVLAAGGGAYATGLFDTKDNGVTQTTSAPMVETPSTTAEAEPNQEDTTETNIILAAYQEAIKSGRISALGQFAQNHPNNSLAKDAEAAAFSSLKRQSSVLAYSTFIEYFPNADTSSYNGPRVNSDIEVETDEQQTVETAIETDSDIAPQIRSAISSRADELAPFIDQGNGDYAVAVIDEMLSLTDLTETEATYLLNLRAKAETASGFMPESISESTSEIFVSESTPTVDITPDLTVTEAEIEIATPDEPIVNETEIAVIPKTGQDSETKVEPDTTPTLQAKTSAAATDIAYDTPAKPIERFGAITPDLATEPGECDMTFSVNTSGKPINIFAACSDPLFIEPATKTVGEWLYAPATLNGNPVQQDDILVKIKFHLE